MLSGNSNRNRVELPYGRGILTLDVPAQAHVLCAGNRAPIDEIQPRISAALEKPVSGKRFAEWVQGAERVLIIVPDGTRNAHTAEVLSVVLNGLNACSVSDDRIRVLIAYGVHQRMDAIETRSLLGDEIVSRIEVVHHDAYDSSGLVHLGETVRGTPIVLNKLAVEADRVILVGAIVPHYFAGFTGGRKSLCPGAAGFETIAANHKLTIHPDASVGLHRCCRTAILTGNPVHEDLLEAAKMVRNVFLINLVLGATGVVEVVAGDMVEAHEYGCAMARDVMCVGIDKTGDVVVASCGGYPADIDLVQAHKALRHAREAVRDGGRILFVAECAAGVGSRYIERWLEYTEPAEIAKRIRTEYTLNAQTAYSLKTIARGTTVFMKSELPQAIVRYIGCRSVMGWSERLENIIGEISPKDRVYVIANAAHSVPMLARDRQKTR
jgi:nickel-dependent lactate racemase